MKVKSFVKTCLITMIIFTCIFTPAFAWLDDFLNSSLFVSDGTDLGDLPVLVEKDSEFFDAFNNANRLNILLTGTNNDLADTIMLISYNLDNEHIDLVSIPRDTYYPRKGHSSAEKKKINSSFKDGGILELATCVSTLLEGMPINYYMRIDYDGIKKIVDSMGGVPVDVTIPGGMHYEDPWDDPPLVIDIDEGYQVLDGNHAIQYLRYRKGYANGDIGRIEAQQDFMRSALKQALGLNLVKVVNTVLENVESDLKVKTCVKLAKGATNLSSENMTTYMVPGNANYGENGLSFWYSDEQGIRDMLYQIYSSDMAPAQEAS